MRTLTGEQRHRDLAHHRDLIEKLKFGVWRLRVETKFVDAMHAAAEGRPVQWRVWPSTDPQEIIDCAAAEFGFDPFPVPKPYDPRRDGACDAAPAPLFEGLDDEPPSYQVDAATVLEQIAALDRLCRPRCTPTGPLFGHPFDPLPYHVQERRPSILNPWGRE
jgi:hypothetical protein